MEQVMDGLKTSNSTAVSRTSATEVRVAGWSQRTLVRQMHDRRHERDFKALFHASSGGYAAGRYNSIRDSLSRAAGSDAGYASKSSGRPLLRDAGEPRGSERNHRPRRDSIY